jgi:DNA (cytosine-5)-methyltransferase 1
VWPEDLAVRGQYATLLPSIPEGRNYLWHTPEGIERWSNNGRSPDDAIFGWRTRYWSFLLKLAKNLPSWTISATPGPSTGPFHWRNRQLSVRELCRLQTFPDNYEIRGSRREQIRQVGNAVPPVLGELLGLEIRRQLFQEQGVPRSLKLIPQLRDDCPEPEPLGEVPKAFHCRKAQHSPHPGEGRGPGAQPTKPE